MADLHTDQPAVYTATQLREVLVEREADAYEVMLVSKVKEPGTKLILPLSDGSQVSYLFDGEGYWHRADTKPAKKIRRSTGTAVGRG
jgi:hypothetical protein